MNFGSTEELFVHQLVDYNDEVAKELINAEIVNTYLNLLSRSSSMSINKQAIFPSFDEGDFQTFFTEEERNMFNNLPNLTGRV